MSYVAPRPDKLYPAKPQTGKTAQTSSVAAPPVGVAPPQAALPAPLPSVPTRAPYGGGGGDTGGAGVYGGTGTGQVTNAAPADGGGGGAPPAEPSTDPWIDTVRAMAQGKSEDFERYKNEDLTRWKPYYDEAASQAAGRPQFKSMRGASGFYDKPTECPPGMGPGGPNETDPCVNNGQGGTGGTGGSEGLGGAGGAAGWGLSPEEKSYLESITGLAKTMKGQSERLFATGMPAYQLTTEHWKKLMGAYGRGGVDAALGPAREQTAETFQGERAKLRGLRGAEAASAEAGLAQGEAGVLGRMPAELQTQAAAGLQQSAEFGVTTGIQTEAAAGGLYGTALNALMTSRLTEEGYGVQQAIAALQAKTQWKIASLQADVSREAIQAQKDVAWAQLSQNASQFEQDYALRTKALDAQIEQWYQQYQSQQSAQTGSLFGAGIGAAAMIGAAFIM